MTRFKGVLSASDRTHTGSYSVDDPSDCRIETEGGTVYWFSGPAEDGYRSVLRDPPRDHVTGTLLVQKPTSSEHAELHTKFRGKLRTEVKVGISLALEVLGSDASVLSEVVVSIETGDVPEEIFQ